MSGFAQASASGATSVSNVSCAGRSGASKGGVEANAQASVAGSGSGATSVGVSLDRALAQRQFQVFFLFLAPSVLGLHLDQALPVGDGNLVVVGVDFAERQEAVAIAAVFDERRLQAGFDPDDLGEVDVPFELPFGRRLDVEIFKSGTVQHHDAGFFRVRGVDQHALRHLVLNSGVPPVRMSRTFFGSRSADGLQGLREGARPKVQEKNGDRNTRRRYHPESGVKVQTRTGMARRGSSVPGVRMARSVTKRCPV